MDYFVLKRGEIVGPFRREELVSQIEQGTFAETDFAQLEGAKHWTPLRELLETADAGEDPGAFAPDWQTLGIWTLRRARHFIKHEPVHSGFVALGIGVVLILLSFWPPLIWLPWLMVATFAGITLFRTGSAGTATVLLAGVLLAAVVGLTMANRQTRRAAGFDEQTFLERSPSTEARHAALAPNEAVRLLLARSQTP